MPLLELATLPPVDEVALDFELEVGLPLLDVVAVEVPPLPVVVTLLPPQAPVAIALASAAAPSHKNPRRPIRFFIANLT
jgi:hypothetical protein